MAEIVAAFAASHAPPMVQRPEAIPEALRAQVFGQYREVGEQLAAAHPQALVVITNEHLHNFSLGNFPAVCIGMAERYAAPAELWLKLPATSIRGEAALGDYLYRQALEHEFDPSFTLSFRLDHGTLIPLHLAGIDPELPIVPVIFNAVEPPMPTMRRCLQWGHFLGDAIRAYAGLERVAVLATGGLSHDIGTPNMGATNAAFDREFLRLLAEPDPTELVAFAQARVQEAGNGAEEVRNWIVARGVMDQAPFEVLFYDDIPGWYTGVSVVSWRPRVPGSVR